VNEDTLSNYVETLQTSITMPISVLVSHHLKPTPKKLEIHSIDREKNVAWRQKGITLKKWTRNWVEDLVY